MTVRRIMAFLIWSNGVGMTGAAVEAQKWMWSIGFTCLDIAIVLWFRREGINANDGN